MAEGREKGQAPEEIDCTMTTMLYAPRLKPQEAAFLKHAAKGEIEKMKTLISKRVDINCVNELDRAAVHFAAASGNDKVLRFLRDNFAEFDMQDKLGMTPTHWAAYYGHVETVKYMALTLRVRLDLLNKEGMTVLHTAAYNGKDLVVEAIKMYIGRLKPSQRDRRGRTPLHLACERGHCEVVRVLLGFRGCNIDAKDYNGRTPLHCAAECGQIAVVDRLINAHASLHEIDNLNRTALYLAAETGQLEALKAITDVETVPFIIPAFESHNKETLLHVAARRNYHKIIEEFAYRCRINAYNADGHTALHVAVLANHLESVLALLRYNANVNMVTYRLQTPLHLAVEQNNAGIVFLLLQCPDIYMAIPDKKQKTPLHLATQGSFLAITDMFIRTMIKRGLTGEVTQQGNVSMNITHSLKGYRTKRPGSDPPMLQIRRKAAARPCGCKMDEPCVCSQDDCKSCEPDSRATNTVDLLPVMKLSEFKNQCETRCVADNVRLRVYASNFRDACKLMKRVMRRRFYQISSALTPEQLKLAEEAERKKSSIGANVLNILDMIKSAFTGPPSPKENRNADTSTGMTRWLDTVNNAISSNKQERRKGAAKIARRSAYRIPDELAGSISSSKVSSLKRPFVTLERNGDLYDIFHGFPLNGPYGFQYGLVDRVFINLSNKFLERNHYDALATELGFAPQHSKSIRDQYGDKSMWTTHLYRLMRIWLSTKEAVEYGYIMKDLCQALSAILTEPQIEAVRRDWLQLEQDYTDALLENIAKRNKAQEKALKQWQQAAAKKRRISVVKKRKSSKPKDGTENQAQETSGELPSDPERELSAAITFPDSFDMGMRNGDESVNEVKTVTENQESAGTSNEGFSLDEEEGSSSQSESEDEQEGLQQPQPQQPESNPIVEDSPEPEKPVNTEAIVNNTVMFNLL